MKGPYERLKYDLRRLWECPECHHRERTAGNVTVRWCHCPGGNGSPNKGSNHGVPMRLLEDGMRRGR